MNDFVKTVTGKKFYEKDVPSLITQLKRIGDILESIQKEQTTARVEERKRHKIDTKRMIAEALEEYLKSKPLDENAKTGRTEI
jgi:hypothetical protein